LTKTLYIHGSADHYGSAKILLDILRIPGNAANAMVVLPHDGVMVEDIKALGIPVYIMNLGVLRRKYMTPWGIVGRVYLWFSAINKLKQLIATHNIARVYVNSANVIVGPPLKQKNQTELVWHLHEIVDHPSLLKNFLAYLIGKADKIISVSKATKIFWEKAIGNKPVHLLYNGMDLSKYTNVSCNKTNILPNASPNETWAGMIGRVQAWKGQHYFLDIIEAYLNQNPSDKSTRFIIAGDAYPGYKKLEIELILAIEQKKLHKRVAYLGYRSDVPEILASLDLLVLPSTSADPLPTVVLEAMAAGKPVLATAQGGALEMVVDQETGSFMPIGEAKQAADILAKLLQDKEKLKEMGTAGRRRVEKEFSAAAFANNWSTLCS
jgi:glycosyltransferase involved in cell wall biosynthesis